MAVVYERMREIAEEVSKVPEAWAVEVSGGEIHIMMSPAKRHELIVLRTARQLNRQLDTQSPGLAAHSGAEIEDPQAGVMRRPDLLVLPEAALDEAGDYVDPKDVNVVLEVVSKSNPENDYSGKMRDYPRIGVPFYVIIDPRLGTGVVLSEIGPGDEGPTYLHREPFTFGETVQIGQWTIDTAQFPLY